VKFSANSSTPWSSHANAALYRIVMVRLRQRHQATIDYWREGPPTAKSKREVIRCLKRYVAREVYRTLTETDSATSIAR
jgi:transposase